jgi:hypothetical protein
MADQDSKKRKVRNLEDVDFDELIGTDRHPQPHQEIGEDRSFNLSFVHSQIEDYPDLSDDEGLMTQRKKVGIAPS